VKDFRHFKAHAISNAIGSISLSSLSNAYIIPIISAAYEKIRACLTQNVSIGAMGRLRHTPMTKGEERVGVCLQKVLPV